MMATPLSLDRPHLDAFELLGEGGTATVERVSHRGATLARKRPLMRSLRSVRRLRNELRALEECAHPGVVGVHGIDVDVRGFFLDMDVAEGTDLYDHCRPNGRFSLARLLEVLPAMLDAIEHVHESGWLHRDVKPSNVIVSPEGQPILLDFGAACLRSAKVPRRGGTPTHMAPEQVRGAPCGPATDLYGLGVTLYELAEGQPPFDGSMMALFGQHLHLEPPSLLRVPGAPPALAHAVDRLLAKAPHDRPTTSELRGLLEPLWDEDPQRSGVRSRPNR